MSRAKGYAAALAALLIASCGGEDAPPTVRIPDECAGLADKVLCSGGVALRCVAGAASERDDCHMRGLTCADGVGCRSCEPSRTSCDGQRRSRCSADGSALQFVEECPSGTSCAPSGCHDLCRDAESESSYLGCDYWAAFTSNSQLNARFAPAVAIGNGQLVPARVTIEKGETRIEVEIPPRTSRTVELAYDAVLKAAPETSLVRGGAYHLRSSVPVTVHQFNPLHFVSRAGDCVGDPLDPEDGLCHSHTNDASLLLPTGALRSDGGQPVTYVAASFPTMASRLNDGSRAATSGSLAIVAMGESPVTVTIVSSAHTLPGQGPSGEPIEALAPGQSLVRTLAAGDVLQLLAAIPNSCPGGERTVGNRTFCATGRDYDLTGTIVQADGPVQVIGGHDCAFVPFDRFACDHLEEVLPPLRTWGTRAVITRPQVPSGSGSIVRVISGADDNEITFDPPLQPPLRLARGSYADFTANEALVARSTKPMMLAQYLVGQGEGNVGGDPSLSIAVPTDQYRRHYNFTTPATYTFNYVDIVATAGDVVRLDGVIVKGFTAVGESGFATATVALSKPGAHELTGERNAGVGILLYGVASYTSYMLPGGLDLKPLAQQGF